MDGIVVNEVSMYVSSSEQFFKSYKNYMHNHLYIYIYIYIIYIYTCCLY